MPGMWKTRNRICWPMLVSDEISTAHSTLHFRCCNRKRLNAGKQCKECKKSEVFARGCCRQVLWRQRSKKIKTYSLLGPAMSGWSWDRIVSVEMQASNVESAVKRRLSMLMNCAGKCEQFSAFYSDDLKEECQPR
jgi:hypothetical protein